MYVCVTDGDDKNTQIIHTKYDLIIQKCNCNEQPLSIWRFLGGFCVVVQEKRNIMSGQFWHNFLIVD